MNEEEVAAQKRIEELEKELATLSAGIFFDWDSWQYQKSKVEDLKSDRQNTRTAEEELTIREKVYSDRKIKIETRQQEIEKEIKKLNQKFRKKNKSTDVLSFPFYEKNQLNNKIRKQKEVYLGDIIINLSQVKNKNNKVKFKEELNKLWIHGLLHLLGYDHKSNSQYLQMQKLEKKFSYLIK